MCVQNAGDWARPFQTQILLRVRFGFRVHDVLRCLKSIFTLLPAAQHLDLLLETKIQGCVHTRCCRLAGSADTVRDKSSVTCQRPERK